MNRMQFDLSQTEDYSPEDNFSYNSEEPLWRSMVLAQFYILSEQRTSDKSGIHSFTVKGVKKSIYRVSQYGLGTWEESLIIEEY